jgi:hypothetical protein
MPNTPKELWLVEDMEIDQYLSAHVSKKHADLVADSESFTRIERVDVLSPEAKELLDAAVTFIGAIEYSDIPVSLNLMKPMAPLLMAALQYRDSLT